MRTRFFCNQTQGCSCFKALREILYLKAPETGGLRGGRVGVVISPSSRAWLSGHMGPTTSSSVWCSANHLTSLDLIVLEAFFCKMGMMIIVFTLWVWRLKDKSYVKHLAQHLVHSNNSVNAICLYRQGYNFQHFLAVGCGWWLIQLITARSRVWDQPNFSLSSLFSRHMHNYFCLYQTCRASIGGSNNQAGGRRVMSEDGTMIGSHLELWPGTHSHVCPHAHTHTHTQESGLKRARNSLKSRSENGS